MSQKKLKSKNLRSVLVTPFSIHWSENNPEGVASLQKALAELLPLAKLEKKSLKFPLKDETKEKTHPSTPSEEKQNIYRTYLAPGFQSVVRGLERSELCCVVMSNEISPPMIQRVICSYCNSYNIPLVVVPQLKTITKSALGFSAMVIGFKNVAESPENIFFPIYEIVSQNRCTFKTPFIAKQKEDEIPERAKKYSIINRESCVPHVNTNDFYLFREDKNERVFRPCSPMNSKATTQSQCPSKHRMDKDFISLDKSGTKAGDIEDLSTNIKKISGESKDDDSDCDSLDEDNIFFVDNKPDNLLLQVEPPSNEEKDSQTRVEFSKKFKNKTNKKVKKPNERYFLSKANQDVNIKKIRNTDKQISKQKPKNFGKKILGDSTEKLKSSTFNPLTIKTIISNPKKVRRKRN